MYVPAHFAMTGRAEMLAFVHDHPFGILISANDAEPLATHVPFTILRGGDAPLLGVHVARANPQWKSIDGTRVLAVFHGAHAFVPASWYDDPSMSVPTWDYAAVHCSGIARRADEATTGEILRGLVNDMDDPWQMGAANGDYIARMRRAIVAFTIDVTSVSGARKYSQNRSPAEVERVIEKFEARAPELAAEMRAYYAARRA